MINNIHFHLQCMHANVTPDDIRGLPLLEPWLGRLGSCSAIPGPVDFSANYYLTVL